METKTAIIYIRVSTQKQAESGLGHEAQEKACRDFCKFRGWEVVGVFSDDGITGAEDVDGRPGLKSAIEASRENGTAFVVYSVSRLARTQSLTLELTDPRGEYRLPLVSATEPFDTSNSFGRMVLGMLSVFAQLESDMASDRTRVALAAAKARGVKLGNPHLKDVMTPELRETLLEARSKISNGEGYRQVAAYINSTNRKGPRGGNWTCSTLHKALKTVKL